MAIDPLSVDTYIGDLGGQTAILMPQLIAAGPPWHSWWGKASEGIAYRYDAWLQACVAAAKKTDRLGKDWWYGTYCYDHFASPFQQVGDNYLQACQVAGVDWTRSNGALNPVIDVESGDNAGATAAQVIDHVTNLVEYIGKRTGRQVGVYAGSLMFDLGLKTMFEADFFSIARYTATLPQEVETRIGVDPTKVFEWQYDGDGQGYLKGYPTISPIGPTDISAWIINGGGENALDYVRATC